MCSCYVAADYRGQTISLSNMRFLIVDDNDLVRRGVKEILASELGWEICGEAQNGTEAIQKAKELLPSFVLLDISMPGMNGLEVARLIRQEVPRTKIIVMSQHDPIRLLPRILEVGGNDCVDKNRLSTDLVKCIKSFELP